MREGTVGEETISGIWKGRLPYAYSPGAPPYVVKGGCGTGGRVLGVGSSA